MKDILKGSLVRLAAVDHEELAKAYAAWNQDTELTRLMDTRARLHSIKAIKEFFEKETLEPSPASHYFSIRALDDDRLLGDINFDVINSWGSRDAFVGIGIGSRADWGRGYGTDAMNIGLRFVFTELNLRRVTLTVFEYNPRAVRSYEKAGFKLEGRMRGALLKDGTRWDMLYMGILREEWMEKNP
ncbi:MAG: GNAT family N-acetyltransferase [Anaerolineales bacterium]|nr:GNAT family N-acetyltransferase [Anaerolineales bacterium]MBP6208816.1 GNAT family N-acetyltransferase [Anaerolineales bacterium]MBP8163850.1 GNAT family N-acetyltransferase [Anaerolineales bacterium]